MRYYSIIKKNETLSFVTPWMELEITGLSELSQAQKDRYHLIQPYEESKKVDFTEDEGRMVGIKRVGVREK